MLVFAFFCSFSWSVAGFCVFLLIFVFVVEIQVSLAELFFSDSTCSVWALKGEGRLPSA